jgi:hypothetical protein
MTAEMIVGALIAFFGFVLGVAAALASKGYSK